VCAAFRADFWQDAGLRPREAPLALSIGSENVLEEESPAKEKAQAESFAPKLDLYFQNSKFRGVNPPIFQIYFCR
jgi:hypothetical protein